MRKSEVSVGSYYVAKVSGKLTTVRLIREAYQGWFAINVATGREVRIKSAAKLRKEVPCPQ